MNSLSSPESSTDFITGKEPRPQRSDHVCAPAFSTTGDRLPALVVMLLMLVFAGEASAQPNENPIVAIVDGTAISLREVDAAAGNKIFSLQQQIFALRKVALDNLIARKILEREAARRNVAVDAVKSRLLGDSVQVEKSKVEAFYSENLSAFASMSPDEAKEKIRLDLETHERLKRYREELAKLRDAVPIKILLNEPRLPVAYTTSPASVGSPTAEVLIIEFSDFRCPYCKRVQPILKQLLHEYGDKIKLHYKYLPLDQHGLSMTLAQAAFCSGKQGKFWEFHDALFNADILSGTVINVAATNTGLNQSVFQECVESSDSRLAVLNDLQEAKRLGIDSTPTFVINGKLLKGAARLEQFKAIIDRELATSGTSSTGHQR